MKLYGVDLSPFSATCRVALYAKGLEEQIGQVPPPNGGLKSPEYLAINPMGKIPTLDHGGFVLPESTTICEYLEDLYPEPSLLPPNPEDRARSRLLTRIVDLYLYAPIGQLFRQPTDPEERSTPLIDESLAKLLEVLGHLEGWIDRDGYAVGGTLSLADCSLVPALFYSRALLGMFGRPSAFSELAQLRGYFDRISQNAHAAKVLSELQAALGERMNQDARAS